MFKIYDRDTRDVLYISSFKIKLDRSSSLKIYVRFNHVLRILSIPLYYFATELLYSISFFLRDFLNRWYKLLLSFTILGFCLKVNSTSSEGLLLKFPVDFWIFLCTKFLNTLFLVLKLLFWALTQFLRICFLNFPLSLGRSILEELVEAEFLFLAIFEWCNFCFFIYFKKGNNFLFIS